MNIVRVTRFKAGICSVVCVVAMLLGGNFSANGQQLAPSLDLPAMRGGGQLQLKVRGIGNFVYELQGSQDLTNWVPVQQQTADWFTNTAAFQFPATNQWRFFRALGVRESNHPLFQAGLMTLNSIDLNGNNFLSDSYNSYSNYFSSWVTNAVWGTNRVYNVAKRNDHGDVLAMGGITNAPDIGSADIYGRLGTGPAGAISIGPNGAIGQMTWQSGTISGIEPGFSSDQMNMTFPSVAAPTGAGLPPPSYSTYSNIAGVFNFNQAGQLYVLNQPLSGLVVISAPNVVIWAKAGINFSGHDGLFIAPGASVVIYAGDSSGSLVSSNLNGQNGVNENGYAKNCQIYGLHTCTWISMNGYGAFVGTIYAPNADLIGGGGGGNQVADWMGGIAVKSITLNGHLDFHFDEALLLDGPGSPP
ncbi:DUF7305 domain-containing protein [Pedosphaera parvula]|uniref:DUF7305 domain-containing protein n=1 Tax=Pedosphaera parvula (strain Ellin514) TaxID=320771 RepID=B9XF91_PEDPL|nr:hypothetical protein [Pedosphaera parvula]EEF61589.1 hypothetical protein Cflav_PD4268 [Pedosphaera parvula Ellin514]